VASHSFVSYSNCSSIRAALSQNKCSEHYIILKSLIFCLLESFHWFSTCFYLLSKSTDDLSVVRLQSIQHHHENV
jgi:hypothetical protein